MAVQNGESDKKEDKMTRRLSWKQVCCIQFVAVIVFAAGVVGGIFIGIYAYHDGIQNDVTYTPRKDTVSATATATPVDKVKCPNRNPVTNRQYEDSIFAPLTLAEMNKVAVFLLDNGKITTIKTPDNLVENFILFQTIEPPNKARALEYLDNRGPKPKRYAKVTVQRGATSPPDIMEYKVGPLDTAVMTASQMISPGDIHFNTRPYDNVELALSTDKMKSELDILAPLIAESFDDAKYPDDIYIDFYNGPPSTTGEQRDTRWVLAFNGFRHEVDVDLIHILPVSGTLHNPGTDINTWWADDFHYLNQGPFQNATHLMDAYNKGTIRKVKFEKGFRDTIWDRVFPKRDQSRGYREKADRQGARTYYPSGARYTVDGTHVAWMDWSFDIGGNQIRGPALFDVKFNNERILYELAVNDITLNYAMNSHGQNNIIYADATYGIMGGITPTTIMKGVDCPEHGTVLKTAFWAGQAYNMSSICIFEADGQEALWRHAGISFEAGLRNRYLVVRVPVVIGNYDYTFEFNLYLDGKIYTFAKASGYIQASFWDETDPMWSDKTRDPFGYRVSDYMTGPIHDHMFGFKVDMDIVDTNNTFQVIKWKAGPHLDALRTMNSSINQVPSYFIYNETRYIEWEKIDKEMGIQHTEDQQFWLVVNEREKNKWGVERGYQIVPLATATQSLKTHPLLKALSYTKYKCAITKRHEDEPTLTSIYEVNRMERAKRNMDMQLNGEAIQDEDIVNWVTVGFLHVPVAEDVPMTVRVETGFLLKPFNFFDKTASFDMPQHTETRDQTIKESEPAFETCYEPKVNYCRFC